MLQIHRQVFVILQKIKHFFLYSYDIMKHLHVLYVSCARPHFQRQYYFILTTKMVRLSLQDAPEASLHTTVLIAVVWPEALSTYKKTTERLTPLVNIHVNKFQ